MTKSWGRYPLRVHNLAYRLRGIAHVLVEEDTDVCKFLKESCRGMNSHHGSIGIYYPGRSAPYKIITTRRNFDRSYKEYIADQIKKLIKKDNKISTEKMSVALEISV